MTFKTDMRCRSLSKLVPRCFSRFAVDELTV